MRKEDVVPLSRKGRGCLSRVRNIAGVCDAGILLSNDLLQVNDGS